MNEPRDHERGERERGHCHPERPADAEGGDHRRVARADLERPFDPGRLDAVRVAAEDGAVGGDDFNVESHLGDAEGGTRKAGGGGASGEPSRLPAATFRVGISPP